MADGHFRFQTGTGQHFYPHFAQRNRNAQRPSSPLGRIPFEASPSRSPGPQSPSRQNLNAMYNANNQHLMNGAGGHRGFGMPMNLNKPYPHQNHQGQQHGQHQDPNPSGHAGSFGHHQHSHSGGMANGGGHFGGSHLQNGGQSLGFGNNAKPPNDHWASQIQLAQQEREWHAQKVTHAYARLAQGTSKDLVTNNATLLASDNDGEQRQRPGTDDNSAKPKGQTWLELDLSGQSLRQISRPLFNYEFLTKLYLNNNQLRVLPTEIGKLRNLKQLDLSVNELRELPSSIGMLVNLKELLLFDNQIETLPHELGNLWQCAMLGLEGNPLNDELKQLVVEQGSLELIKFIRENAPTPEPPNDRDWIVLDDTPILDEEKLTVFHFNTLCQHYCTASQYGHTPAAALSWEHRREVILDELRAREPDIMCLQEVEWDSFENFYRSKLAHLDYKGAFWAKTRHKTMDPHGAKMVDGCATFYKNSKYILLDKQVVDLPSAAINRPDMKGEPDIYNRVMPKDNIAVITFLENRMSGARLIVVNAHLHWDHAYKDVKVVQVAVLLEAVAKWANTYASWPPLKDKEKQPFRFSTRDKLDGEAEVEEIKPKPSMSYSDPLSIPLIFSGDFNSLPHSGPYDLIEKGHLPPDHSDLEGRKYGKFTQEGMNHPFQLKSAYTPIGELPFTNYTPNFTGVVDYIWFSKQSFTLRGILGQVDPDYIDRVPAFPNVHFPSDHLALFAEFGFKNRRIATKDNKP